MKKKKNNKWFVKVDRPSPRLVWMCESKIDANRQCAEINERYQTTEYYVEEYDVEKALQFYAPLGDDNIG